MFKKYLLFYLLLALLVQGARAQVQGDVNAKLSITTQMFLDEMSGGLSYEGLGKDHYINGKKLEWSGRPPQRLFAAPDTIDGKAYISAFIHLEDIAKTDELKALGVEVMSVFKESNRLTALIPVPCERCADQFGSSHPSRACTGLRRYWSAAGHYRCWHRLSAYSLQGQ